MTINYNKIYGDIIAKKYPQKKEECLTLLQKETLSAIDRSDILSVDAPQCQILFAIPLRLLGLIGIGGGNGLRTAGMARDFIVPLPPCCARMPGPGRIPRRSSSSLLLASL